MHRRSLLATAAAAMAATSFGRGALAYPGGVTMDAYITSPDYLASHSSRFIELDLNSQMDFMGQYMKVQKEYGGPETHPERSDFLKANGYPLGPTDLTYEQCHDILMQDPAYAAYVRTSRTIHEMMWDRALRSIYKHEDFYLSAMEMTDTMGPGKLELNPKLAIPEYASYEIHEQPGGYVGNPFAGLLYHLALTNAFYHGMAQFYGVKDGLVRANQQQHHIVSRWPGPPDGKVRRVLDVACSAGNSTIALREKYDDPAIEVWGLDVGGPMVRYAHHRTVQLGEKINYRQALAEDTGFPDNYFDVIGVHLLFHELPVFATRKVVAELQRITRPGGVWVGDGSTGGARQDSRTIINGAKTWVNHRFNNETWEVQNLLNDFPTLRKEGGWGVAEAAGGRTVTVKV